MEAKHRIYAQQLFHLIKRKKQKKSQNDMTFN